VSVDLGRLGAWGHLDTLPIDAARAYARRVDELGYGTLWVPETVGREPFTLLGLLAAETRDIRIGTSIVSIWGHDAQTTRMAAMTLQEATGGRFVLGLGVSHLHLAQKLRGHTFDRPLTRMREYLAAYRAAIYRGPMTADGSEPPVLLAALRERMLSLAATDADGAFPYLVTPERVAWTRGVLDAAASAGAPPTLAVSMPAVLEPDLDLARDAARAYLAPYLRTPAYQAGWLAQGFSEADWEKPASDRLVDAMVAWGDVEALRRRVGELTAAGADHVAVIPVGPDGATEHLPVLEALAAAR
jgi:probable F420-dependent oxidoreductase